MRPSTPRAVDDSWHLKLSLASIFFALFAVYGWLGLAYSTPLTATIVSLVARTITLGAAVIVVGTIVITVDK